MESSFLARARGFTLVEMVVVLAIITVITVIILSGQASFNRSLILTDTAYTVAFSARQAQSFGVSSRAVGAIRNAGYGLRFDRSSPSSFILFADTTTGASVPASCPLGEAGTPERKPGNCRFDAQTDPLVDTYTFSRGFAVSKFCGLSGSTLYCSDSSSPLTSLDIVYARPNTSATMSGEVNGAMTVFTCAELHVADPERVSTRTIRLSQLGEVSIGQTCTASQSSREVGIGTQV
jgi:prepilin-type N-terminal cleavage/methylation domain-containing protein